MSKYKVGDRVRIKTWQQLLTYGSHDGHPRLGSMHFPNGMEAILKHNRIVTIAIVLHEGIYCIKEDESVYIWSDDMIEGYADESITNEDWDAVLKNIKEEKEAEQTTPEVYMTPRIHKCVPYQLCPKCEGRKGFLEPLPFESGNPPDEIFIDCDICEGKGIIPMHVID